MKLNKNEKYIFFAKNKFVFFFFRRLWVKEPREIKFEKKVKKKVGKKKKKSATSIECARVFGGKLWQYRGSTEACMVLGTDYCLAGVPLSL